jgi:hypothetical protein
MNEPERAHHPQGDHDHHPYWKSAHRDWRVWVVVGSMLAAMTIYVMSNDLAWGPRSEPKVPSRGLDK